MDGEVVEDLSDDRYQEEPGQEVVPVERLPDVTLFGTSDPGEVVEKVTKVATVLKDILRQQRLTQRIGSNDHVRVEGWQTLGSMIGVFPVKEQVEEIPWPATIPERLKGQREAGLVFGYKASYRAQTLAGAVVGGAEGTCRRTESKWHARDDYALMSMAQTRAMSKALKAPLGFIVTMAGYEATPAEEMDGMTVTGESAFGPPMAFADVEKLSRAMVFLTKEARLAVQVRDEIEKDAGGYVPRIVCRALLHTARAARDGAIQREEESSDDSRADDDAGEPGYDG